MSEVLTRAGYPSIKLPAVERWPPNHMGRNVNHGYQRGWGLEFGDLAQQIPAHPLYLEAREAVGNRSIMSGHRIFNLFLIITEYMHTLESKNCIEFGVYRGGSTIFMAYLLKKLYPGAYVYSLDTFEGMPASDSDVDLHGRGDFSDTSLDDIKQAVAKLDLDNIHFLKGPVERTFPAHIAPDAKFGLAHIDLDIYPGIRHCQRHIQNYMTPGGYVIYDDATASSCIGATQAVEEYVAETNSRSEQIYPHFVFRAGLGA